MAKDPYKLLGVTKSADDKAIRSAYRKLAKKYHPDVNSSDAGAEKFKEITAAYNLLSNPELKSQYDRGSVDANGQQKPFGGFGGGGFGGGGNPFGGGGSPFGRGQGGGDMSDMLESLFGMQMGGGSPFGGGRQTAPQRPKKGGNIRYRVKVSFFEAWTGRNKTIKPKSGASLKVSIPAGVQTGDKVTMKGRGKAGIAGGAAGDAVIDITVEAHKMFRREGKTVYLNLPVTLSEVVSAAKIPVITPEGEINVTLPSGERVGQKLRLRGKGIKGGDLIIQPIIKLDSLTVNALKGVELPSNEQISSDIRSGIYR